MQSGYHAARLRDAVPRGRYILWRWREPLFVRFGLGGRLAFKPNKTLGGNWEGKAPAEAFTHQARQEPRTPVEIASNLKKKARRPPRPDRTPLWSSSMVCNEGSQRRVGLF